MLPRMSANEGSRRYWVSFSINPASLHNQHNAKRQRSSRQSSIDGAPPGLRKEAQEGVLRVSPPICIVTSCRSIQESHLAVTPVLNRAF